MCMCSYILCIVHPVTLDANAHVQPIVGWCSEDVHQRHVFCEVWVYLLIFHTMPDAVQASGKTQNGTFWRPKIPSQPTVWEECFCVDLTAVPVLWPDRCGCCTLGIEWQSPRNQRLGTAGKEKKNLQFGSSSAHNVCRRRRQSTMCLELLSDFAEVATKI